MDEPLAGECRRPVLGGSDFSGERRTGVGDARSVPGEDHRSSVTDQHPDLAALLRGEFLCGGVHGGVHTKGGDGELLPLLGILVNEERTLREVRGDGGDLLAIPGHDVTERQHIGDHVDVPESVGGGLEPGPGGEGFHRENVDAGPRRVGELDQLPAADLTCHGELTRCDGGFHGVLPTVVAEADACEIFTHVTDSRC